MTHNKEALALVTPRDHFLVFHLVLFNNNIV